jgi:hypothetical protein
MRPQLPGSAQNDQRRFLFFRTTSCPFAELILCMWSDPIMILPHAKYDCQICVFERALQLRTPWSGSSGTESVHTIRSVIHEYIFFPKSNTKKQTKIVSFYDFSLFVSSDLTENGWTKVTGSALSELDHVGGGAHPAMARASRHS